MALGQTCCGPSITSELNKLIFERDQLKKILKRTGLTTKVLEIKFITKLKLPKKNIIEITLEKTQRT